MPLPFFGHRWRDVWGSFVSVARTKVLKKFVKKATSGEDQQPPKEKYLQRIVAMINRDGSGGYLATRCAELLIFCKDKHKSTTVRIKSNLVVHSLMQRSKTFCDALEKYNDYFKPCPLKREVACPRGLHFQFLGLKAKHYSQGLVRPSKFTNGSQPKKWISLTCNGKNSWVVLDAIEEQIDLIISLDKFICEQIANEEKKAKRENTEKTDSIYDSPIFAKNFHLTIDNESYPDFIDNPLMQDIFRLMAIEFYSLVVLYESLISKFAKEYFEATLDTCRKFLARFHGYLKRIESMKKFRETLVKYTMLPASQCVFEFGCSLNLLPLLETHLNKLTTGMTDNLNPSVSAEDSFDNNNKTLFFAPELIESYVDSWPTPPIAQRGPSDQISESTSAAYSSLDSDYEENNNFSSIPLNATSDSTSMNFIDPFVTDWDQDYQFSPFLGDEPTDSQNKNVQEPTTMSSPSTNLSNTSDVIQ